MIGLGGSLTSSCIVRYMSIVRLAAKKFLCSSILSYTAGTLPAFLIFSLYESLNMNPAHPPFSLFNRSYTALRNTPGCSLRT